jgi:hypothetical protein
MAEGRRLRELDVLPGKLEEAAMHAGLEPDTARAVDVPETA